MDPLSIKYPWNSPYSFSENVLIDHVELEGLEKAAAAALGSNRNVGVGGKGHNGAHLSKPKKEQIQDQVMNMTVSQMLRSNTERTAGVFDASGAHTTATMYRFTGGFIEGGFAPLDMLTLGYWKQQSQVPVESAKVFLLMEKYNCSYHTAMLALKACEVKNWNATDIGKFTFTTAATATAGVLILGEVSSMCTLSEAATTSEAAVTSEVVAESMATEFSEVALNSFEDIVANPRALWGKTANEVEQILGEGWTRGTYGSNGQGWKFTRGDKSIFYNASSSAHGGAEYYGFSSGTLGKNKIVDPGTYLPRLDDGATIIFR